MNNRVSASVLASLATIVLLAPSASAQQSAAQSNVPASVRQAEAAVERTVERFGIGIQGGVGLDPELIDFGAHATFAPIFDRNLEFRPGVELGLGEVTTVLAFNLDVVYILPGATSQTRWMPYVGAGPSFGLSHRGFETEDDDNVDEPGRFDFSDTDFNGGFNFIAGARNQNGVFFEIKATAYGVSNIRLLAGFNF